MSESLQLSQPFVLFGLQIIAELIKTGFVMIGREDLGDVAETDAPLRVE